MENVENKENEKGLFSEILKGALDFDILDRALSNFLKDNYGFADFDLVFKPPLELSEQEFKALINELINHGFIDYNNPIWTKLAHNHKSITIYRYILKNNINGKITYSIEQVTGYTYTD